MQAEYDNLVPRRRTPNEVVSRIDPEAAELGVTWSPGCSLKLDILRLDRSGIRKVLGDLEAEIMECVWGQYREGDAIPVRAVYEQLRKRRGIAYTTVMSTMARLARKGMLEVDTAGQAYTYRPGVTRAQLSEKIVEHVMGSLMVNFAGEMRSYIQKLSEAGSQETTTQGLRRAIRHGRRKESS